MIFETPINHRHKVPPPIDREFVALIKGPSNSWFSGRYIDEHIVHGDYKWSISWWDYWMDLPDPAMICRNQCEQDDQKPIERISMHDGSDMCANHECQIKCPAGKIGASIRCDSQTLLDAGFIKLDCQNVMVKRKLVVGDSVFVSDGNQEFYGEFTDRPDIPFGCYSIAKENCPEESEWIVMKKYVHIDTRNLSNQT